MNHWIDPLQHIACTKGIKDGRQYDTFAGWWGGTQHADDMLSLLAAIEYRDDRTLRLLSCRFVRETRVGDTRRTVWELLTDERSRKAVVIAELYAEGDATSEELGSAEGDAVRAAASAAASAVWETWAAWDAAKAAARTAARDAARAVARVARAVAWATATSASVAATKSALAQQAEIIRDMIPVEEIAPLFERYIEARKKQLQNNHND